MFPFVSPRKLKKPQTFSVSSGVIKWEHRLEIGQDKMCLFNPFIPNAPFTYPPENIRKPFGFLMCLGAGERVHWERVG